MRTPIDYLNVYFATLPDRLLAKDAVAQVRESRRGDNFNLLCTSYTGDRG